MTPQEKIDDLYARTTAWSERVQNDPDYDMSTAYLHDPEFVSLIEELMEQDMDTLMVLIGKSVMDGNLGDLPEWLVEGLNDDDDPS